MMTNQFIHTAILIAFVIIVKLFAGKAVNRILVRLDNDLKRKKITMRIINLFSLIFMVIGLAAIWNIDRSQLMVFITSLITVLGIAFFAQWSILSNITSSLILFFNHPVKIGQRIRVLDREYEVEGKLIDISFYFLYIKTDADELVTIPTSVALQKTLIIKD
ncbi:MAG: mechanosensitive ion channel family protein [Crocinitomicaceae bacterium]|nr:mechanosensitive ion channel family protein [Crocinitomicaceae bacterium]